MDAAEEFQRLRRQRTIYGIAAATMIIISIAVSLPRTLQRRNELKVSNEELLRLQEEIRQTQAQTRAVQQDILAREAEVKKALGAP